MSTATLDAPAALLPPGRLHLPAGLVGLPAARHFDLRPVEDGGGVLAVLRCLDRGARPGPALARPVPLELLVVAPAALWPGYRVDLPDDVAAELGITHPDDAAVAAVVTARRTPAPSTANLFAPVVFHRATGRGLQHVPSRSIQQVGWGTEEPLPG